MASSTMIKGSSPAEIKTNFDTRAVAFSATSKCLFSGDVDGARLWWLEDGGHVARLDSGLATLVRCLAISRDGKWIVAGTDLGNVFLWNARTYDRVLSHKNGVLIGQPINGVDFSSNSSRFVSASKNGVATIWDVATRKQLRTLRQHGVSLSAAKYSPQGDRIATANSYSIRIWEGDSGRSLMDIPVPVKPWYNMGLVWSGSHLFVVSGKAIKRIDTSTGSTSSEWAVSDSDQSSCIALPYHGEFIAYAAKRTIKLFDALTQSELAVIENPQDVCSLAFSADGQLLAIGELRKATIKNLKDIVPPPYAALLLTETSDSWKQDQLPKIESTLTATITGSMESTHLDLANRALVRARLQLWDLAIDDAKNSVKNCPSVIGYIAMCVAFIGAGRKAEGCEVFDSAYRHCDPSDVDFLGLIKSVVLFMAGKYDDAISHIDDLITTVPFKPICHVVQAQMCLLLGNMRIEQKDYDGAVHLFKHVPIQLQYHMCRPLFFVSLISGWKFDDIDVTIQRGLCEALFAAGRVKDAVESFHQMMSELQGKMKEHLEWALDFKRRSSKELESHGDMAAESQQHNEAISHFSTALSLDPPSRKCILFKRGKAYLEMGLCEQALADANEVIAVDPSWPWGYQIRHAALHKAGEYDKAIDSFTTMLSKIAQSPDADIRKLRDQYVSPSKTRTRIRKIVQRTVRRLPRALINTVNGRIHDRTAQASSFESSPIFGELVSSMTTRIDRARIKHEVQQYFRYVMLSHRWDEDEPSFQQVIHVTVYDLENSLTHDKLQMFCKIVRDAGFVWAWSDTCCINKLDHFVLQEALVAMFRWYRGSSLVVVFLRGVRSSSPGGTLVKSVWNTRAWTLQEYVAGKVVHFYTEDWTPYLDLPLSNHKDSREVIAEMEQVTGVSAEQLMALRPGLTSIREKLRLASDRQTTVVEDAAYSLLGIFSAVGIPAIYGEGDAALGRLLANLLTRSGDESILAWTGESGRFNSCLPARISVFSMPAASHLPPLISDTEMEGVVATSQSSSFNLDVALRLYDRLDELSTPRFAESRLTLPCIAFQLPTFSPYRTGVYRVDTVPFGMVEIKTKHDLSRMGSLYLVHPWLDALMEYEDVLGSAFIEDDEASDDEEMDDEEIENEEIYDEPLPDQIDEPVAPGRATVPVNREAGARRLATRLRQPFGALLVAPTAMGRRATDYRRVAADCLITVRFQENVTLGDILENVRVLDVL